MITTGLYLVVLIRDSSHPVYGLPRSMKRIPDFVITASFLSGHLAGSNRIADRLDVASTRRFAWTGNLARM
jgi:hypothetical protein